MSSKCLVILAAFSLALFLGACTSPNPQLSALTPIPTLAQGQEPTAAPAQQPAAPSAPSASVSSALNVTETAALGAPIYLSNCSPCHGLRAEGVVGPALRDNAIIDNYFKQGGDQSAYQTVANGRPGTQMPAWLLDNGGPLADTQIKAVLAYLRTVQNVPKLPTATPLPPEPTETPAPPGAPTPAPAQPSQPGKPGAALSLTGDANRGKVLFGDFCSACHGPEGIVGRPNPDSDDGTVPGLNPIDETIKNPDPKKFASNVDAFIEHGSIPAGSNPLLMMPAFGDSKLLSDQQIADLIAYVMSINK